MGKKRKYESVLDAECERTMYSSFVTAANAVSQLYTQGVQQQRRAAAAASKATLEKVVSFVLRENGGQEHISKAALLQFLQHEYENADSQEVPAPQPQMQFMPFAPPGTAGQDSGQDVQHKQPNRQLSGSMSASPLHRSRMAGVDDQQHIQQQQPFQQLAQQHAQQLQHQGSDAMHMQGGLMHAVSNSFPCAAPGLAPNNIFMVSASSMQ
eukprot:GHRR01004858.1.p1 GENE.GHRR01004858.1~~GHRR01004858.1.p1  ORF type:complete len:210 (+),score=82.70 GHRR01004858.1:243-872(+)